MPRHLPVHTPCFDHMGTGPCDYGRRMCSELLGMSYWRKVDPKDQPAVDANFRLKNQLRANEIDDLSLGLGWGYFVEPGQYKCHLKKYVGKKDRSRGSLHSTRTYVTQWFGRFTEGGVVGTLSIILVLSLMILVRNANVDWIVMSAVMEIGLLLLMISYIAACQWKINLKT
ncbi:hypothetical protein C8R45DRAFT_935452 [Mycena sanguinolenta]|nr:hypothetical protein C8R45DRAFT_935452 [Mycena sanguinolenta]